MQAVLYLLSARPSHSLVSLHDGGCRALIQCMRRIGPGHCYASSMSPPAVEQVMSAMRVLRGQDGSDRGVKKIQQLRDNANYFRQRLTDMGCSVLGSQDSPVMVSQKQLSSPVFPSKEFKHVQSCC
jgi:7-keto-8-aminopelargonate synthetase-like enzyme